MSGEMDIEIRKLPVKDLIQGLENLNGIKTQLGDSISSDEIKTINIADKKLRSFLKEKLQTITHGYIEEDLTDPMFWNSRSTFGSTGRGTGQ